MSTPATPKSQETQALAAKALEAQALGRLLFEKEIKELLWFHWRNLYEDSQAFFAMVYGQYIKVPGPKQGEEKGVRGIAFMSWANMADMRKDVRRHIAANGPGTSLTKAGKEKNDHKKTKVSYVPIDYISPESNVDVKKFVREYDPNTSFVVCMQCESPRYTDVKIVPRIAHDLLAKMVADVLENKDAPAKALMWSLDGGTAPPNKCCRSACTVTATTEKKLSTCGRCGTVMYCSRACQLSDRVRHKSACIAPQAAVSSTELPLPVEAPPPL